MTDGKGCRRLVDRIFLSRGDDVGINNAHDMRGVLSCLVQSSSMIYVCHFISQKYF